MGARRSHSFAALIGLIVGMVVMAVLPAAAGDGDPLILADKNVSVRVTRLNTRGGLRIDNFREGKTALILNVIGDTPPMQVNSETMVDNLNADLLDGFDAAAFLDAATYDAGGDGKVDWANRAEGLGGTGATAEDFVPSGEPCPPGSTLEGATSDGEVLCARAAAMRTITTWAEEVETHPWGAASVSMTLDQYGNPVIAYWEYYFKTVGPTSARLMLLRCDDPVCAGAETPQLLLDSIPGDSEGLQTHVAVAVVDDTPMVAFNALSWDGIVIDGSDLKVVVCSHASCDPDQGPNTVYDIDTGGNAGYYPEMGVDADHRAVIAYRDEANDTLKVARCGAGCASVESVATVDSGGLTPSMAFDPNWPWHPIIAHYDEGEQQVEVVSCDTAGCTGDQTGNSEVAATGGSSIYSALDMQLTPGGLRVPVIAYLDSSVPAVYVVECGDRSCSTAGTPYVVSLTGEVNIYPRPQVFVDFEHTVVAYPDSSPGAVVVSRCNTTDCSTGFARIVTGSGHTVLPGKTFDAIPTPGGLFLWVLAAYADPPLLGGFRG